MLFYGETQHKPLVIRDANVWRGKERGFVQEDLLFENGKVVESLQGEADQFDAGGKWVIPGLIDAHFHAYAYSQDGIEIERGALSLIALNGSQRLGAALRRGFTTVRDVAGGDIGLGLAIQKSLLSSPRYLFTGPALSQTGGHGDPRLPHIDLCLSHLSLIHI